MRCIALIEAGIPLDGASDHGVSEALYLRDPDENGVELYRDRPEAEWPRKQDGSLAMFTKRLDLEDLLRQRETPIRHCEERSDEAIQLRHSLAHAGLRRVARRMRSSRWPRPRIMISTAAASSTAIHM